MKVSGLKQSHRVEKREARKGQSRTFQTRLVRKGGFHSLLRQAKYQDKEHIEPSNLNHTTATCKLGLLELQENLQVEDALTDSVSVF